MSGSKYLLDTNVIIGFLAGAEWAVGFVNRAIDDKSVFCASSITRMELLGFPGITSDEENRITSLLDKVSIVSISREIEDEAITIRRSARLKLPDAIIAATAMTTDATLVTADDDFKKVSALMLLNPAAK